jgi:hypothetical protein
MGIRMMANFSPSSGFPATSCTGSGDTDGVGEAGEVGNSDGLANNCWARSVSLLAFKNPDKKPNQIPLATNTPPRMITSRMNLLLEFFMRH